MISLFTLISAAPAVASEDFSKYLAKYVGDNEPWLHMAARSEQAQPLYLGATPREIALRLMPADKREPAMYESLRARGQSQARSIRDVLVKTGAVDKDAGIEFEMWPVMDVRGQLTWAFGRWRLGAGKPWERLNASILSELGADAGDIKPILPVTLDPRKSSDFSRIFEPCASSKDIGENGLFSDCVWTDAEGRIAEAWLAPEKTARYKDELAKDIKDMGAAPTCRVIPQPSRLDGKPATFIVKVTSGEVEWPASIKWKKEVMSLPGLPKERAAIESWPDGLAGALRDDVLVISGEREAVFPSSGRKAAFTDKNSAAAGNSLGDLVAYLEERYKALGLETHRQEFSWRGIPQTNLVAKIPGKDPSLNPVVLVTHIDTAFSQEESRKPGGSKRVSSPGADDDCTGTAAALAAAKILGGMELKRPIMIVHLTGSEFPSDSLGARRFIGQMLKEKKDAEGLIVIDAIGRQGTGSAKVRVSAGDTRGSLRLAKVACDAARDAGGIEPSLKFRFDPRSRIFPTDGHVFAEAGYPVMVLSEERPELGGTAHQASMPADDSSKGISWDYAASIAKTAIETAAELANAAAAAEPDRKISRPDWSVIIYTGADEPDSSELYGPRIKSVFSAPVPDNIEVIAQKDLEWPDGTIRAWHAGGKFAEQELPEDDSASPAAFTDFLKWAGALSTGRYKVLVVQGRSFGIGGLIQDNIVPSGGKKTSVMTLADFASSFKNAGFKPDILIVDVDRMGRAEVLEELKDTAPYIILSQLAIPINGFPQEVLYRIAGDAQRPPRDVARDFPEEYVKLYSDGGPLAKEERRFKTVAAASIDTAKWGAYTGKFKRLADALKSASFATLAASRPGWAASFIGELGAADIVEFLNRLSLLCDDVDVRAAAAELIDDIGYPDSVAADNAATVTLDPAKVRSFELKIDACPYPTKDRSKEYALADWKAVNQDLAIPDSLSYDCVESRDGKDLKREFTLRCPDGALKKAMTFRLWLPGAKNATLTAVDPGGRVTTRRFFRDKDYFSVKEFPETSFLVSEAHTQGGTFIHGLSVDLDASSMRDLQYRSTAWNARTGWGDIFESAPPAPAGPPDASGQAADAGKS
jgi:hypothetical protein